MCGIVQEEANNEGVQSMFTNPFVLLDTEYTANVDSMARQWKGEHREIIQIGAMGVSSGLREMWQFGVYVRPLLQPQLTSFITKLTGITQEDVDAALALRQVLAPLELLTRGLSIYCYGEDGAVIHGNCMLLDSWCPIPIEAFINLKPILRPILLERDVDPNRFSSGQLITAFGKEGKRAHNALSDVQNLLLALQELRERGCL